MASRHFFSVTSFVSTVGLIGAAVCAAEYAGKYEGANLSVVIAPDGGSYGGEIRLGEQRFPLKAREEANRLSGHFTAQGTDYGFTATLQGDGLTLITDGTTYALRRLAPPAVNPLGGVRPANPLPAGRVSTPASADALAGYTVVNKTDFGRALSRELPKATSVRAALQATFPDLARYFGARPEVLGAYEDQKDHKSAGVSFTAQLDGKPVKGFVSSKVDDHGATVAVVYCRADASQAEWTKLISPPPAAGPDAGAGGNADDEAAALKAAAAKIPLRTYNFPDNTGSIGIAEGWTTNAQTLGGATINGPADQQVFIGLGAEVITGDNPMIRMQQQQAMNARQFGQPAPPPINMLIADYSPDPAVALKNLIPAISQMSQRHGGPSSALEQIVQTWKVPAMTPNGNAGLILFDSSRNTAGTVKHYRALTQLEVYPLGPGAWAFYATELIAPKETFKQDLPVMLAQSSSVKENAAVIQEQTRENIAAQNQRFAAMQAANKQVQDAFDARNKAWERNQLTNSRVNADFDETIRGYRTVEDTATGNRSSVDLGNVHDVVDRLNQYDPGRYKEIPLRDELYPLPGHER